MYSLFFLFSCSENVKSPYVGNNIIDTSTFVVNADGDGYMNDEDCDDTDSSVFPTAIENVMVSIIIVMAMWTKK